MKIRIECQPVRKYMTTKKVDDNLLSMLTNLSDISISNDEKVIELVTEVLSKVKNIEDRMAATKKGRTERKSSHEAKNTDDEHIKEIRSLQKLLDLGFIYKNDTSQVVCTVCHDDDLTIADINNGSAGRFNCPNHLSKEFTEFNGI